MLSTCLDLEVCLQLSDLLVVLGDLGLQLAHHLAAEVHHLALHPVHLLRLAYGVQHKQGDRSRTHDPLDGEGPPGGILQQEGAWYLVGHVGLERRLLGPVDLLLLLGLVLQA